jgi:hypothetical protein
VATLYCRPSDILSYAATWSLPVGTADSAFPLANLNSVYAHIVSKTTGTAATYRGTISSTALQAIAIINCNLAGLTLTVTNNNSMASTNLVIPSAPTDNVSINGFVDLRAVTTAATQWNIAITGASDGVWNRGRQSACRAVPVVCPELRSGVGAVGVCEPSQSIRRADAAVPVRP